MQKIFLSALVLVFALAFGNVEAAEINYGASKIYNQNEMDAAIKIIKKQFGKWKGCKLHNIRYAGDDADNAENFPTLLIISLIGSDSDVMESFLLHVKPDDVAVILRRWPSGKIINSNVLRKLLDSNDARILVPVLGAMKTHFPNLAVQHKKRLKELESHSTAAVRAWARKLTK